MSEHSRRMLAGIVAAVVAVGFVADAPALEPDDPSVSANLKFWLDVADRSTIRDDAGRTPDNGSFDGTVATWQDKSGNDRHVTQSSAVREPAYVEDGMGMGNQKAAVRFDGGDDALQATTAGDWTFLNNGTDNTVFVVTRWRVGGDIEALLATKEGSGTVGFELSPDDRGSIFNDEISGAVARGVAGQLALNVTTPDNSFRHNRDYVVTWRFENGAAGDDGAIRINESPSASSEPAYAFASGAPAGALVIGDRPNGPTVPYDGDIAEVIIYDRALTSGEIDGIEDYLYEKYFTWTSKVAGPIQDSRLRLWLDATDLNGDGISENELPQDVGVTSWTDKSGNGNSAVNSFSGSAPVFARYTSLSLLPMLRFDGWDDQMSGTFSGDFGTGDDTVLFIVALWHEPSGGNQFQNLFQFNTTTTGPGSLTFRQLSNSAVLTLRDGGVSTYQGDPTVPPIQAAGALYEFCRTANAAVGSPGNGNNAVLILVNGAGHTTSGHTTGLNTGTTSFDGPYAIGNKYAGIDEFDGDIAEILVYNGKLTTEEHNQVGGYLEAKYGLDTQYVPVPLPPEEAGTLVIVR